MRKKILMSGLVGVMLLVASAEAKTAPVTLSTKSYKEVIKVDASGHKKVVLEEAKKVVPGDFVVYKNAVKNNTTQTVQNMVLNNAIPEHTIYVGDSAKCAKDCDILFSVDGGKEFAKADKLMIQDGDKKRLALPKEYTNVRWVLSSLEANSITNVSFKTRLQ